MTNLICISCPKGCHLSVDEENGFAVTGNGCPRGEAYGKTELLNPTRTITSTVKLTDGMHPRLPVKTDSPISKKKMFEVMELLNDVCISAPVRVGDVLLPHILGTETNIVATKTVSKIK